MLDIVFGWQGLDSLTNTLIDEIDKAVIIFPHTSVYDIITFIPYVYQKCFRNRLFVMARESAVNNITGNMYYSLFFNPVVIKESKQGKILKCNNVVDSVVNQLKNKDRFLLFISPEGSRDKKPWKSGYYHIARELNVPIIVMGFDYHDHSIKLSSISKVNWSLSLVNETIVEDEKTITNNYNFSKKEDIENKLKNAMSRIIPLYPECSYVNIDTNNKCPCLFGNYYFIIIVIIVIILILVIIITYKKKK